MRRRLLRGRSGAGGATDATLHDTYVTTRDVAASLTAERVAVAIGGLRRCDVAVGATDPLAGRRVPVRRVSCSRRWLVVALDLTDAPRPLTIRLRSSPAGAQG